MFKIRCFAATSITRGGAKARQAFGLSADRRLISIVGRLMFERRPVEMLRPMASAALCFDDVDVVMGGEGEASGAILAEAERLGLAGHMHLPGAIRTPRQLMAEMDVYVSLNIGATTGIAGLEAAATGVAVVALQGIPDRPRLANDWIWSDTDPDKLGDEIVRLLRDDRARAALGCRQRAQVEADHSAETMFAAYVDLYRRAGVFAT